MNTNIMRYNGSYNASSLYFISVISMCVGLVLTLGLGWFFNTFDNIPGITLGLLIGLFVEGIVFLVYGVFCAYRCVYRFLLKNSDNTAEYLDGISRSLMKKKFELDKPNCQFKQYAEWMSDFLTSRRD